MQNDDRNSCKHVFVCGLPRSGTSVLGRNVARLENCSGLKNTGALEDEGEFLQDVYPLAGDCGGDGRFGFDPRMHVTEKSDLLTPNNVERLLASWSPYWDERKTIFVEKTPSNLLRMRFLQAAFPNSYFVVVRRHPVPVGIAAQKWKINVVPLYQMFKHWLQCHRLFDEDKKYLNHVYELRYEDYVENPDKYHQEIATFIGTRVPKPVKEDQFRIVAQWRSRTGLRVPEHAMEEVSGVHNKKYFDRWSRLLTQSTFKSYYRYIARKYESEFAKYGYSLTEDLGIDHKAIEAGKLADAIGAFYCRAADTGTFFQRVMVRVKGNLKQAAWTVVPKFVIARIRRWRERSVLSKEARAPSH
jgi:hypothetical protein